MTQGEAIRRRVAYFLQAEADRQICRFRQQGDVMFGYLSEPNAALVCPAHGR
jgi:hypothetical protein